MALEPLGLLLDDEWEWVRFVPARAILRIAPPTKRAIAALQDLMASSKASNHRRLAAETLGELRSDGMEVVASLRTAMMDESEEVRQAATQALEKILGDRPA